MLTDEQIADVKARAAKNAYFAHDPESYRLNRVIEDMATEYDALRGAVSFHLRHDHPGSTDPARGAGVWLTEEEVRLLLSQVWIGNPKDLASQVAKDVLRAKLRDALGREAE